MQSVKIKGRVLKPRRMMELVEGKLCVRDVVEDRRLEGDVKTWEDVEEKKRGRKEERKQKN